MTFNWYVRGDRLFWDYPLATDHVYTRFVLEYNRLGINMEMGGVLVYYRYN